MSNANEPASPVDHPLSPHMGLTKREAMAMHIMGGFATDCDGWSQNSPQEVAKEATRWADALLAELARTEG